MESTKKFDNLTVIGHPAGLFLLFFTEMWERFSYYGMRALLVLFLTSEIISGGWEWTNAEAGVLYGTYTFLVYLTPIFGGLIADKITGFRNAILIGALLMTLGHASMAMEGFGNTFFYLGLLLLILGNGMFKPNISSIVGDLYKDESKKDAGYTIFYMGINAGAFLGILLCGYLGEKVGWHYGFGLAGIFMFFGMLMFYFGQSILGDIGLSKKGLQKYVDNDPHNEIQVEDSEPDELQNVDNKQKISNEDILEGDQPVSQAKINKDRLIVIGVLAFFTIFFWWAFEQAGTSMTIFARDYTDRTLIGSQGNFFKIIDAILTFVPIAIVTWVLVLLSIKLIKKHPIAMISIAISFVAIWMIGIWKTGKEFSTEEAEIPASWFGVLNSFFIISFAPVFSKIWSKLSKTQFNPSGPMKFAFGLILLGLGFGILSYGSSGIINEETQEIAKVSVLWLTFAYLFHTLGELCLSPVGLSYVSKLAPKKLVGLMFGLWFFATAIANLAGGLTASSIDQIVENYSVSFFFMIFTIIPILAGLVLMLMNKWLLKKMHGIK